MVSVLPPFSAPLSFCYIPGHALKHPYHMDFVCFGEVVVEVKAVSALSPADEAQLLNYLAMSKLKRGLLLNFGSKSLEQKRMVL